MHSRLSTYVREQPAAVRWWRARAWLPLPVLVLVLAVATAACDPPQASPPAGADEEVPAAYLGEPGGNVAHGNYLASIFVCRECHTLRGADGEHLDMSRNFAGGIPFEGPWGVVETANVTMVASRLPIRLLENTIRGRMAFKFQMPTDLYSRMAADDMADLMAYLRTLPRTPRDRPKTHLLASFTPPPPNPATPVPEHAPRGRSLERGRYLVTLSICQDCHSPRAADGQGYDMNRFLAGGGFAFRRADGVLVIPPNLTPDVETGIGGWSEEDIVRAIRTGIAQDGHRLNPLMPYSVAFEGMTDDDAFSIAAYLKSVPPVRRALPENPRFSPTDPGAACCFEVAASTRSAR